VGCYPDKIRGSNDPSDTQTTNDQNNTSKTINGTKKLEIFDKHNSKNSTLISTNTKKSNNSTGDTSSDLNTTSLTTANNTYKKEKNKKMSTSNGANNLNLNDDKVFKTKETDSRKKIVLGKGYSLMDWIRFTKETPDLAGNQGILRKITYEELAKHNKEDDCWLAIYG
jgi:hypothetical protein